MEDKTKKEQRKSADQSGLNLRWRRSSSQNIITPSLAIAPDSAYI